MTDRHSKILAFSAKRFAVGVDDESTKIVANVLRSSRRALGRSRWVGMAQRLDTSVTAKTARLTPGFQTEDEGTQRVGQVTLVVQAVSSKS